MTTVVETNGREVARPLAALVPLIKQELQAANDAGLEHYRRAGEMLLEAKAQVPYGEWQAWMKRHFHLSIDSAQDYMRLARESQKTSRLVFSTLSEAVRPNRAPRLAVPEWTQPVQQITNRVNVDRLAIEQQNRAAETRLDTELALQLIAIGYKVLATKLHPDKRGGSREAMMRLNRVRDLLRRAVQ